MELLAQLVVSGMTVGAVYAIVGLGFVVIYKATKTLNFAHGELLMLGAIVGLHLHVSEGIGFWVTFVVVVIGMALLGLVIERIAYRPLAQAPITTVILATAAIGGIIRSAVRIQGEQQLSYFPPIFSTTPIDIPIVSITPLQIGIAVIAIGVVIAFWVVFQFTPIGRAMRAVSENQDAASLVGIRVSRIHGLIWAIAAAFAAAAGLLIAPTILITPDMGIIGIKGFIGAVLGGFNSLGGAVVGSLLLGVVEQIVGVYFTTSYRDVVTFSLLLLVLLIRPHGLFGRPESRRV